MPTILGTQQLLCTQFGSFRTHFKLTPHRKNTTVLSADYPSYITERNNFGIQRTLRVNVTGSVHCFAYTSDQC